VFQKVVVEIAREHNKPVIVVLVVAVFEYEREMLLKISLINLRIEPVELLLLKLGELLPEIFAVLAQQGID